MRHKRVTNHFGRRSGPRKALIRGLVDSLVEHGRIRTTIQKAKELRRHVEKAITTGKKNSLHARRTLLADFPSTDTVKKIVDDLSVRFKERPGGYTRIIKVGRRPGDNAEMALIEFVDYELPSADEKTDNISAHTVIRNAAKYRRRKRKLQQADRRASRLK